MQQVRTVISGLTKLNLPGTLIDILASKEATFLVKKPYKHSINRLGVLVSETISEKIKLDPSLRRALALRMGICLFVLIGLELSPLRETIEVKLTQPAFFRLRDGMGLNPRFDPHIKTLVFDDKTLAEYPVSELSVDHWVTLLERLAARKVRRIVIDKLFSLPMPQTGDAQRLAAALGKAPPVIIAAIAYGEIPRREHHLLAGKRYSLETLQAETPFAGTLPYQEFAYGPHPTLSTVFPSLGHNNYDGNAYIAPIFEIGPERRILPHLGLAFGEDLQGSARGLNISGASIPLTRDGYALINFLAPRDVDTLSLRYFLKDPYDEEAWERIQPGDSVLIVPNAFTGNTSRFETAFGRRPGSDIILAVANSAMTGIWLTSIHAGIIGILGAALLALLTTLLPVRLVGMTMGGILSFHFAASLFLFVKLRIMTDWAMPEIAFTLTTVVLLVHRIRSRELVVERVTASLHGLIPQVTLKELVARPEALRREPTECVVTVIFIDVVGFTSYAETASSRDVFLVLRQLLRAVANTIHDFGGIVDRSLGDGLMGYFGYSMSDKPAVKDHADRGLECALQIQRDNVAKTLADQTAGKPVFPLRIGINTAGVFLGDLGDGRRLDFSIIGLGVNVTQRLEAACEPGRILFSASTHDLLTRINAAQPAIQRRMIPIKHHEQLLEVYEFDPFHDCPEKAAQAATAYKQSHGLERREDRIPVVGEPPLEIVTSFGAARVVNISLSGISLCLPSYLARGVAIDITWHLPTAAFSANQKVTVHGEVRWGRAIEGGTFLHGVLLKNLTAQDKLDLFERVRTVVAQRVAAGVRAA